MIGKFGIFSDRRSIRLFNIKESKSFRFDQNDQKAPYPVDIADLIGDAAAESFLALSLIEPMRSLMMNWLWFLFRRSKCSSIILSFFYSFVSQIVVLFCWTRLYHSLPVSLNDEKVCLKDALVVLSCIMQKLPKYSSIFWEPRPFAHQLCAWDHAISRHDLWKIYAAFP